MIICRPTKPTGSLRSAVALLLTTLVVTVVCNRLHRWSENCNDAAVVLGSITAAIGACGSMPLVGCITGAIAAAAATVGAGLRVYNRYRNIHGEARMPGFVPEQVLLNNSRYHVKVSGTAQSVSKLTTGNTQMPDGIRLNTRTSDKHTGEVYDHILSLHDDKSVRVITANTSATNSVKRNTSDKPGVFLSAVSDNPSDWADATPDDVNRWAFEMANYIEDHQKAGGCLHINDESGQVEKIYFTLVDPGREFDMDALTMAGRCD